MTEKISNMLKKVGAVAAIEGTDSRITIKTLSDIKVINTMSVNFPSQSFLLPALRIS
jgi:hypothetical protein